MDFNQIQEIIRMVSKHKLSEFSLKEGDFKLVIRNQGNVVESSSVVAPMVMPVQQPVVTVAPPAPAAPAKAEPAAAPAPAPAAADDSRLIAIKSPMVGTFYRSSGPDKPPFIKVGDVVEVGAKVCIIEAMKLFNEIDSEVKGKVVKILVDDATPVEYDQPLFMLEPA
ncbi:MAG: acetyl-CoA carboxylase biotin carboxyl carrier protein [Saprospiraceae bacterium]|nr:acetyl-CoA carboxylase biotin carboxyl carrier protein [Saprospiraceae bacterium]